MAYEEPKKPSSGLAILIGAGKPKPTMKDDEPAEGDDELADSAGEELAETLGVPTEKQGQFLDALKAYVMACK